MQTGTAPVTKKRRPFLAAALLSAVACAAPPHAAAAVHPVSPGPRSATRLGFAAAPGPVANAAGQDLIVDTANGNSPYAVTASDTFRDVRVGNTNVGVLNHSAGTLTVTGGLILGNFGGSNGTYNLSGTGILLTSNTVQVGGSGTATFTQSGGSFTANGSGLLLGDGIRGNGTYNLSGNGSLTTTSTTVSGDANTCVFTQSGTSTHTTGPLVIGDLNTSSNGTYNLDGGTLAATTVRRGSTGTSTFNFNGGTLQTRQDNATFFEGLTTANVRNRGATVDTAGFNVTVAQPLLHSGLSGDNATDGGLTKRGTGTLTLTGANTYTGATTVSAGTLLANNTAGSATGTGALTVQSGGTLGGTGAVAGAVTMQSGGRLNAGNAGATGMLTLASNLSLNTGATLGVQLGGTTAGTGYDQIRVAGTLTLGGTLSVTEVSGFKLTLGQTFVILDHTGTSLVTTTFSNVPANGLYTDAAGNTFRVNYAAIADADLVPNDVTLTVVPEPSTWALLAVGIAGLGVMALRRLRVARA